ncbi:PP2C family protein-serine/threonine phosphatase [Phytopseudomonas dryadis]|uniref:Serine/threonine protein phosphatase n=1 Tax=Phytopseudomonas dryadis TaxID=2487520 RepID=A0A4Q9R8Q0_9GAMM|nr:MULTISPECIES: protein phosphatase 2C domain-containing protein [Pseudomonas]TBU96101.1 serine/threonine protein phosphatase [Pseudomonas dryadis]TBV01106.1 serine/threonine protein phosphatase [Pseudomonas dryadis]TBV13816.1 serine/threonine protein phosphatase [Pseudomonas sp. FRB 230]
MSPSRVTQYRSASHTHVGMVRQINEDACLDAADNGLWAVADGMGGHASGDYVSSLIIDSLRALPPSAVLSTYEGALVDTLDQVNTLVRAEAEKRGVGTMGSTVVLLAARGDEGLCLWAGDSRLYRLRKGDLQPLSRDHSYVQELIDSGLLDDEAARHHPMANIVTRALGVQDDLQLEALRFEVRPGDTFLLCSDGLNKTVDDHELREVLAHEDPYQMVRSLVHLGLTRGAPDNITAVVIKAS